MTMHDDDTEQRLDTMLAEAADSRPDVPDGLMSRVLADADAVAAERAVQAPGPAARSRRLTERLLDLLPGGWAGAGGLVAATCAGFWIGISPPAGLPDTNTMLFGSVTDTSWSDPVDGTGFGWIPEEE